MTTKNPDFFRGRTEMTSVSTEKPENPKRQLKNLKFSHGPTGMKIGKKSQKPTETTCWKAKKSWPAKKNRWPAKKPCLAPCWHLVGAMLKPCWDFLLKSQSFQNCSALFHRKNLVLLIFTVRMAYY